MRKLFKKSMPLLIAGLLLIESVVPMFATVTEKQVITSNETAQTEVTYTQESKFEVKLPKLIDLGSDKLTKYFVSVSGDISSDDVVTVVPEESFLMKDKSGTSNLKEDVEATVTQDKTEWIFNEFETKANGNISAPNLTAGNWEGSFFFNIKLDKASVEEAVTLEAGLYDINGILLCDWEDSELNIENDYCDYYEWYDAENTVYNILTNKYPETTKIVLPEDVTHIGNFAFADCDSLISIIIPNTLISIGESAFEYCSSLTSITIPSSVISIGSRAFEHCSSLTSITIPSSVISISSHTFSNCSSLTSITIPEGVTSINAYTFSNCSSLTSITIPESVTSIGYFAFSKCTSLTSITIPESVTSIGYSAFMNCSSLTSVTIPSSVTSIENSVFYDCTSLTSITIPESVTSILDYSTFSKCSSLTSIIWNGKTYTDKKEFNKAIQDAGMTTVDVWT